MPHRCSKQPMNACALAIACLAFGCSSPRSQEARSTEFTHLPPAGESSPDILLAIAEKVKNARPGQKVVLFAHSGVWWVQPLANEPFTPVQRNSNWKTSAHRLSAPDVVHFRDRLDNYETAWIAPTASREADYTDLGPGSYRFHLMAKNPNGKWSAGETTLAFRVDPLFWQSWWFRAALVLAFAGAIAAYFRLRMQRLAQRLDVRFEERLAERTRIAQELYDTLLQGFMSASMQVHIVNDSLPADSQARATLTRALRLMQQVIDEGRNTVRGLRSTSTALLDLETALTQIEQESTANGRTGDRAQFQVVVEGRRRALHPILRDEVYRIGREALLNAFRHSSARKIEVELQYSPNQLRLLVRDDGCGIEPQVLELGREGHWGLIGMRERAEQIGARLHVYSRPAGGTEVDLAVPGQVAFRNYSASGLEWFKRHLSNGIRHEAANAKRNGK